MRLFHVLSIVAVGTIGSAIAVPRQDAPLAETQFKNIQSFKGAKASDIIPSMQFMCASLKVDCEFCHTEDRASDEKRPKETTREMIAMQREINNKNFGGRNQVTCATCHAGHTHPVAVPPVEGAEIRARRSADVDVAKVEAAFGKAAGGDPSHPVAGIALKGTSDSHGEKSKFESTYSGEKFTFVTHGAKGDQREGFNGTVVWFTTPKGIQSVPLQYAAGFVRQNWLVIGQDSLPKLDGTAGATAKIGDRDMLVVSGSLADKTRVTLYFDKKTGLLARTQFSQPTILGNILQTNDFSDYKKVGGTLIPMTIVNHTAEGDTVIKYNSAHPDGKIAVSSFDPPAK